MAHPFLTEVSVAGPFAGKGTPAVDPVKPLASKEVTWTQPVVGPPGRIPLPAAKGSGEVVAFVVAEVTAPKATRTRLQLGADHPLKVWLNGQVIYQDRPGQGQAVPDQASAAVELREGANTLVFQVTYQGDKEVLYARLLDPERRLRHPEPKD
jgi:hypothetical protein